MLLAATAEWLTGFWLISVGVAIGLILLLAVVLLFRLGGLLGLSKLADSSASTIVGAILTVVVFVGGLVLFSYLNITDATKEAESIRDAYALPVFLLIPFSLFVGFGTLAMFRRRSQEQLNEWLLSVCKSNKDTYISEEVGIITHVFKVQHE